MMLVGYPSQEIIFVIFLDMLYNTVLPGVLVTIYSSGSDFLSYYSDDEPEIVSDSNILTISLGSF